MRGHIVKPNPKRSNLWGFVVELPRDPMTGKRKQKWHSGYRTRREAETALAEVMARVNDSTYVEQSRMTLAAFLDEWLPSVRSTIRPSTFATYETVVDSYIKKHIGALPLQAITPLTLKTLYADLLATGKRNGKDGLSPSTVRYVHAVLRKALKDAVRSSYVQRNVAELVDPPRVTRPQIRTWSAREVRTFLDHVRDDRLYAAYVLAATTGMRRGEVLGLRWQDVDLDQGRVSVSQALVVVSGYDVQFSEPKTAKGRRSIALDETTRDSLKQWRESQLVERALWGDAYEDADLVFAREDGTPLHPDLFSDAFWRHVASAKLPRIRFHDLRHTHATLALSAGIHPKVVSERLGHASIVITLDTYSHAIPALQETAAELVASLVFSSGE